MTTLARHLPRQARHVPYLRQVRYLPLLLLVLDAALIALVGAGAVIGREHLPWLDADQTISESLGAVAPLMLVGWVACIGALGGYRADVGVGTDQFKLVLRACLLAGAITAVACYITKFDLSRGFFLLAYGIGVPVLVGGRYAVRQTVRSIRRRGGLGRRVLISGTAAHVDDVTEVLRRESWLGYHVIGAIVPAVEDDGGGETPSGVPILGRAEDAAMVAATSGADVLFLAAGAVATGEAVRELFWTLEAHEVSVVVAPTVTDISEDRVTIRPAGGLPLIHIDPPTSKNAARWGKRLFDLAGATALLVALAPLLLAVYVWVKVHDRGPAMYSQIRVGRDSSTFRCWKFRTMDIDADDRLAALKAATGAGEMLFKLKHDPRVTSPGRLLRRFSIDEIPQLFNVITGEMSLVGPRPAMPSEVELYDDAMSRRLHVRPGLTGLWQVSGRSDLTPEEAFRLDLYYVDNWSMLQDLSILARTATAVLGSRGAY